MDDYEEYFKDILKLNPSTEYYLNITKKLKHYENIYDTKYINENLNILKKYKNTKNKILKNIIDNEFNYIHNIFNIVKYIPLVSFDNDIINFEYENKDNKYKKQRQIEFNEYIETCIINMKEGIKKNITIPKIICKKLIKDLYKYRNKYNKLYLFLKNEYYKKCKNNIGLCYLKNGKKLYKSLIKYNCGFYISPEKIHKYGLLLLNKLHKEKQNENIHKYFKTNKEILNYINNKYKNINKKILPLLFYKNPLKRCLIKRVPINLQEINGLAYYNDNERTFYINLKDKKQIDINSLETLIMHETIPGHHLQFQLMKDLKLPLHKIYGNNNDAYIEGWALYSEKLNNENKYSYIYDQLRIIRLVVDTGINYYGWSYKKAYKFMEKYLYLPKSNIKEELERYISIPTQALTYKLGEKYILHLKYLYIEKYKLGNIKDFHLFYLEDGVVSFTYLKNKIETLYKSK